MPALPIIAVGIAARAAAKKIATRAAGGIIGKGGKNVNPVYNTPVVSNVKIKAPGYRGTMQTQNEIAKYGTPKPMPASRPPQSNVTVKKSQAQINAEGKAKARAALGLSPKATSQELASRASKEKIAMMKSRIKRGK